MRRPSVKTVVEKREPISYHNKGLHASEQQLVAEAPRNTLAKPWIQETMEEERPATVASKRHLENPG
jgi:hypothetical protein